MFKNPFRKSSNDAIKGNGEISSPTNFKRVGDATFDQQKAAAEKEVRELEILRQAYEYIGLELVEENLQQSPKPSTPAEEKTSFNPVIGFKYNPEIKFAKPSVAISDKERQAINKELGKPKALPEIPQTHAKALPPVPGKKSHPPVPVKPTAQEVANTDDVEQVANNFLAQIKAGKALPPKKTPPLLPKKKEIPIRPAKEKVDEGKNTQGEWEKRLSEEKGATIDVGALRKRFEHQLGQGQVEKVVNRRSLPTPPVKNIS